MTAVIRLAEARRNASVMISTSVDDHSRDTMLIAQRKHLGRNVLNLDENFHIVEAANLAFGQGQPRICRDCLRERSVGITRKDLHRARHSFAR